MERVRVTRTRALLVTFFVAGLAACSGANKQLSRTDIQLAAGDLRTFASATRMIIEQCSAGHATETFCRQQAEMLSSKIDDARDELKGNGGPAERERGQLEGMSAQLSEIVDRAQQLSSAQGDAENAGRIASISKAVEDTLRK